MYKSHLKKFNFYKNGDKGDDGRGIGDIIRQYYLSTSKESPINGEWRNEAPTWEYGKYLFIRDKITYTDGDEVYTTPYCDSSWEAVNDVDAQILAWCYENDRTYIDGSKIYASSITADKIKVNELSSLSANLGSITGGSLNINDKFIVDSEGNATVDGVITARSGSIAGFTFDSNKLIASHTKTFDFTTADYERARDIIMEIVTPTEDDYARLDVTGDGNIHSVDYVIIKNIVESGYNSVTTNFVLNPTYNTNANNEGVFEVSVSGYHTTKITNIGTLYSSYASFDELYVGGNSVLDQIAELQRQVDELK